MKHENEEILHSFSLGNHGKKGILLAFEYFEVPNKGLYLKYWKHWLHSLAYTYKLCKFSLKEYHTSKPKIRYINGTNSKDAMCKSSGTFNEFKGTFPTLNLRIPSSFRTRPPSIRPFPLFREDSHEIPRKPTVQLCATSRPPPSSSTTRWWTMWS